MAAKYDLDRYLHAARELERFATLRVYEATDPDVIRKARPLLRLCVGVKRQLLNWSPRAAALTNVATVRDPSTRPDRDLGRTATIRGE